MVAVWLDNVLPVESPLLRYEQVGPHRLFVGGLAAHHKRVEIRRNGAEIQIWPGGAQAVEPGGWFETNVR